MSDSLMVDLSGQAAGLDGSADGRAHIHSPGWPASRAMSLTLTLAVALSLALPVLLTGGGTLIERLAALLPGVATTLLARLLFALLGDVSRRLRGLAIAATALAGGALSGAAALGLVPDPAPSGFYFGVPLAGCLLSAAGSLRAAEGRYHTKTRRIFIVASARQLADATREVASAGEMRLVGYERMDGGMQRAEEPAELLGRIAGSDATTLVLSDEALRHPTIVALASELNLRGVRVRRLNQFYEAEFGKVPLSDLNPSWFLFDVREIHSERLYGLAKRAVEGVTAALLLILALPLFPLIALAIKLESPGAILFQQTRVGKDGMHFSLTKFRTMTTQPGPITAGWATTHGERITRVGRVLRKFHLDETPQLWNVLRGHLSLVGPRPEQPQFVEELESTIDFYAARHCIRPGLTGWAQINNGYAGSVESSRQKLQYDLYYIKHQSLRLDLAIIGATVREVLAGDGE
jgi:exopolysaccharide biosynthesis polyprenyl glycosylphosphotransferase